MYQVGYVTVKVHKTCALQAFHRLRRTLTEDFGIDPSPRLRDLEAAILRQDPALNPPAPGRPAARPLTRQPGRARPRWCHGP
jgi:DNA-binding SARP family transcriptional activator